jgi:hypothetical protein
VTQFHGLSNRSTLLSIDYVCVAAPKFPNSGLLGTVDHNNEIWSRSQAAPTDGGLRSGVLGAFERR